MQQNVGAAFDQRLGLLVDSCREAAAKVMAPVTLMVFGGGPHGAGDEAGLGGGGEFVGGLAGELGGARS